MKNVTIIVPGLTHYTEISKILLDRPQDFPHFLLLLSKAYKYHSENNLLAVLASVLQQPELATSAIAEITALYDGVDITKGYWLRADPVVLKADLAAVYMYGNQHIHLSEHQIAVIHNTVQPLLNDFSITLYPTAMKRWYLQLTEMPCIQSIDPNAIIGKDITNFLSQKIGTAKAKVDWQRLQTEIQMALHQLSDISSVNALWFWGAGEKLISSSKTKNIEIYVDENDAVTLGIAKHFRIKSSALPTSLNNDAFWNGLISNENLLLYNKFVLAETKVEFCDMLYHVENEFLKPLFSALKANKIHKISLNYLNGTCYQFSNMNFYYFWKRIDKKM